VLRIKTCGVGIAAPGASEWEIGPFGTYKLMLLLFSLAVWSWVVALSAQRKEDPLRMTLI